jgi:hypothetical protein
MESVTGSWRPSVMYVPVRRLSFGPHTRHDTPPVAEK